LQFFITACVYVIIIIIIYFFTEKYLFSNKNYVFLMKFIFFEFFFNFSGMPMAVRPCTPGVRGTANWALACWWVTVAGWQWWRWKEEVETVRMVVVGGWQWQYWLRYGCF
jgi:hypothetical protein